MTASRESAGKERIDAAYTFFGADGATRGHSGSAAMTPFDRAHTTSYSTLIETMRLPSTVFREIASYLSNLLSAELSSDSYN